MTGTPASNFYYHYSGKDRNLADLKKELEVDDHKITLEELYRKTILKIIISQNSY